MKLHELKTIPPYFEQVRSGTKTFELRKNDRGFQVDDLLLLREYIPGGGYTGRGVKVLVRYILEGFGGLESGYCILGIFLLHNADDLEAAKRDNRPTQPPPDGAG